MRAVLWTVLPLALGSVPAVAQTALVRLGTHDGYGRIVFEFPHAISFTSERTGNTVLLHFPGGGDVPSPPGATRNVAAVDGGAEMATVTVAPEARLRIIRLGNRVVMDVLDAAPPKRAAAPGIAAPANAPASRGAARSPTVAATARPASAKDTVAPAVAPAAEQPAPRAPVAAPDLAPAMPPPASPATFSPVLSPAPPAEPVPPQPVQAAPPSETLAIAAVRAAAPADSKGSAIVLPFGPTVAAALFKHADEAWVVFDERRPLDLGSLSDDPVFASATVELLPSATLLRLKLPPARDMRLARRTDGWSIIAAEPGGATSALMPVNKPSRLLIPVSSPGQVVVVPDVDTGQNLLVGTLKAAGPGVPVAIRVPQFAILPSVQGVVVDPISDRTSLRAVPEGFAIETGGELSPMPADAGDFANAAVLTRRFDFPAEPVDALLRRLQSQVQQVAQAPAQARLAPRKAAAQTMLALGLGAEAQSLLRLAVAEDPRGADDPDIQALSGIAALLSGRTQEAGGLDAPGLSGTDEIALWRAVRTAMSKEDAPEAAPVFAATAGLIMVYPTALRNRLLPIAAETMVKGGMPQVADALLAHLPDEPLLAFARATRLEQKGETAAALTMYDALANGRDRLASARAATRATLLRLSSGAMTPAQAASALERGFADWRGDARERDLRVRTADIEAQAGQWQKAIGTLKETAQLFPADAAMINGHITDLLGKLLHGPGATTIAPLDLVTLADANADAVAQTDSASMALLLADKLTALDLPKRAAPVIEHMAASAPPGVGRATLGARLAALRLGEGDAAGAATALSNTDASDLPPPLQEERGLIDARIHAQSHDIAGATAILSALGTQAADELRATILGNSGDWRGASLALASVAARVVPETGSLDAAQQDVLLRLASAQSRAGDEAALHALGAKQATRMSGPRADMFRLLTAAPVAGVRDLHRVGGDIALAKALPSELGALGSR